MLIDERPRPLGRAGPPTAVDAGLPVRLLSLEAVAAELYADVRVTPFLRRLLSRSGGLLGATAGSISLVDRDGQRYHKVAERGALCQLGHVFPLDEGVTGRVVARRGPVVLGRYRDVASGHLPDDHPARGGSVLAVPIWWRGEVIGVNVGFAGVERTFSVDEVDALETLSQLAAAGIVQGGATDPSLGRLVGPVGSRSPLAPEPVPPPADPAPSPPAAPVGQGDPHLGAPSPFTRREGQVAALLVGGLRDRDIAHTLVISPRTVEKHVAAVLRKTGASSRTAAVVRCVTAGWVTA